MTGRKPKTAARQMAEGDPSKRGINKLKEKAAAEPQATHGLPECPRHLKGRARASWRFWATELEDMGLDRRPDAQMLEGACVNYSRAVEADLIAEKDGLMVEEAVIDPESGERTVLKIKAHPAIAVSNAAWRQVRAFCSEFGLSPVSRTRLAIEKKDVTEDLAAILSQPRAQRQAIQ
jgi:P27 family predicted phage terminase small subunit